MQARSLAFNYELGSSEEYSDYVGLPGYSGLSPRSARPPVMPDFDERSSTGSPPSLGSGSTSPCRTEDDVSQDAAYSPVYGSTAGSSGSDQDDDEGERSFSCFRMTSQQLQRHNLRRQENDQKKTNIEKNDKTAGKAAALKRRASDVSKNETVAPKDTMVDHVLRILEIYTFPRSIDLLANQANRVCTALLRYIAAVPTSLSRAEKVVLMIVQHAMFFRDFLHEECILETLNILQKAHRKNDCSRCFYLSTVRDQMLQKLASVAEGGFGAGEIASHLVGDTPARSKEQTALALTYVVRDAPTLYTLLFDCGAMDLLFDILQVSTEALDAKNDFLMKLAQDGGTGQRKDEIQLASSKLKGHFSAGSVADVEGRFRLAVGALREIGKTCRMVPDEIRIPAAEDGVCDAAEIILKDGDASGVTLELDGGKALTVHRDKLIQKSAYFAAMLRSDGFAESHTNSVRLPRISETAVRTVLHALVCRHRCVDRIRCLDTAIQCLELSHMLLLTSLETSVGQLVGSLMHRKRDVATVYPRVALFEGSAGVLRPRCVAMLLAKDGGSLAVVAETFRTLLSGALGGHLLDDIRVAVKKALLRKGS
ncbi:hypothetical protein BIW11_04117 [Tropilaelaps mercedesae]|uniref:BTB domain-containing protein n=1 Tax=Tropilaelaps mercedesae TaxID=418985 RepID=A0A1V9XAQ6_9ACAR|nr:hypothetical protein BIW11_04117 [Tropilaelaps mercedesae]